MKKILINVSIIFLFLLSSGCITNSNDNNNDIYKNLQFIVEDADTNSSYIGNSTIFEVGEPLIKIIHENGTDIDWNKCVIKVFLQNIDPPHLLKILSINGITNLSSLRPPYTSHKGDVIICALSDNIYYVFSGELVRIEILISPEKCYAYNSIQIY